MAAEARARGEDGGEGALLEVELVRVPEPGALMEVVCMAGKQRHVVAAFSESLPTDRARASEQRLRAMPNP